MLVDRVRRAIDNSVLCWLATVDAEGAPSVSPKEVFTAFGDHELIIAHIASPGSVRNIESNPNVCASFIDIFVQKGFKVKGTARVLRPGSDAYPARHAILHGIAGDRFPIHAVICIHASKVEPIIAPSYRLYPDTTEAEQRESAAHRYGVRFTNARPD